MPLSGRAIRYTPRLVPRLWGTTTIPHAVAEGLLSLMQGITKQTYQYSCHPERVAVEGLRMTLRLFNYQEYEIG